LMFFVYVMVTTRHTLDTGKSVICK